jgi:hypothetical protein
MTATTPTITRRPHFRRHDPPPIAIQDDDVAIIRFVYEGRFRRSTDICNFMRHRPAKKIVERLTALYHTGYLDRPSAQRDYFAANRRRPHYIYALGNRGAQLLAELDGIDMPRIDWGDKNRVTKPFIHHRLLISSTVTAFQQAVKDRTDIRFIEPAEILARAPAAQALSNPWKWRAKVPTPTGAMIDAANVPDAVFGLDFTEKRLRYFFTLEADRATMPVWRSTFSKTSLYGKFLTYYHAHRAGFHTRTYNISNFRVLTVTTTPERTRNAVDMIQKKIAPSNMFLFTDVASLQNARDVLALAWTTAKGQIVHLAD